MHNTNLSKFLLKRKLPNKRKACQFIRNETQSLVSQIGAGNFHALVMPSPNLYDINILRSMGVPDDNMTVVENNPRCFKQIVTKFCGNMTDAAADLTFRVSSDTGLFHWINLDMCGPLSYDLFMCVTTLAQYHFDNPCFLTVTIKCGRESPSCKECIKVLAGEEGSLQTQREAAANTMIAMPLQFGWKITKSFAVRYKEDRLHGRSGNQMYCFGAVYVD